MKINAYTINTKELENLAISADIPILGNIATIKQMGNKLMVSLSLIDKTLAEDIEHLIGSRYPGIKVEINQKTEAKTVQPSVALKKNIHNIIAISSGKGGVGKSSTTINLALAMAANGAKVGVLDADIYGPSQPTMLGMHQQPKIIEGKIMLPNVSHGLESNSIGYLVDGDSAIIWRAPIIIGALDQLMDDTAWGSSFVKNSNEEKPYLDYLFIDLPPDTGDISLSLAQKIPVTGVVTVTTPQDIALIDAKRSLKMFKKMQIDNLGIIENMSTHICENCGHEGAIFGKHGGQDMAIKFGVPFLGDIPLNIDLRQSFDRGVPLVITQPEHPISQRYKDIAQKIAIAIAHKPKNFSKAFGNITIENK